MNTKNNQRTRISKILFKNAIMDLLKEKGTINKVSVRELCEKAQLNRSTFYAHYNEPKDILLELENEILEATYEHLKKIGEENNIGAHKYLLSFLEYIKENDKQFRTLLIDSPDTNFKNKFMQQTIIQFVENLEIVLDKKYEQYIYSYILNGSTGIILQWMRSAYSTDADNMCKLLFEINESALKNLKNYIV